MWISDVLMAEGAAHRAAMKARGVPMCTAYNSDYGFVRLTDPVADHYEHSSRDERRRFDANLTTWLKPMADAGMCLDRVVIRLSQYRKWTM